MTNLRIRSVVKKEFREYRRNKLIVFTMAFLPLILFAVPMFTALAIPGDASSHLVDQALGPSQMFLLLIALILPSTVAAYTVIGERDQGTLEPVLTTPATDGELLFGKAIAATVPAVCLAWVLYMVFAVVVRFGAAEVVVSRIWRADQFVGELVLVPLLSFLTIMLGMMISSRTSDMRVAQQLSGLVILPMVLGYVLIALGVVKSSVLLYVLLGIVLGWIDVILWKLLLKMFDRERLLTRFGAGS